MGHKGQKRLAAANVLLVGVGGLGSAAGSYLAAAGVGGLGLVDPDVVQLSNLQRQTAYITRDVGRWKVYAAAERFRTANPDIRVITHRDRFGEQTAKRMMAEYDFIIDATDNFDAKFLIADMCHAARKAYSHAGILEYFGQTMTVVPGASTCYRCVFPAPPPDKKQGAVPRGPLGAVPGVIGAIQATEAIKHALGIGNLLTDRLLTYNALTMQFREIRLQRDTRCTLCGSGQRFQITNSSG